MTLKLPLTEIQSSVILSRFEPRPAILEIAKEKQLAIELLDQLVVDQDFNAAFDVIAFSMVPQAVIWWGCLCLWGHQRDQSNPDFENAMQLIIQWLQHPQEKQRRMVEAVEDKFGSVDPIRFLIQAVVASHGSMAPEGLPEVDPPKFLYAALASGAIKLVAAGAPPASYPSTCKQILRHGMEVLQGANRWQKKAGQSA